MCAFLRESDERAEKYSTKGSEQVRMLGRGQRRFSWRARGAKESWLM
jgi:hypothetical protein